MLEIATQFKKNKLKLTPQRLAILNFLRNTKSHPSAHEIYESIYPTFPTISLATIYKTLKTLAQVKLINELNLGEGNFRYDGKTYTHSHFYCNKCNKIEDIEIHSLPLPSIKNALERDTKNKIDSYEMYLFGVCEECLLRENKL